MTPHELLYLLLSNCGYPDIYMGYRIKYFKIYMECDIIVDDNVLLVDKIKIMKEMIKKLGTVKIKFKPVQTYEIKEVLRLFWC